MPGRAHFYTRDAETGRIVNAGFVDNSVKWAGGGFVSTAEDLVAFANALLEGRLSQARDAAAAVDLAEDRGRQGHRVRHGLDGRPATRRGAARVRHSGGAQGGTANLVIYPDEALVVAMIVNSDESFTGKAPHIAEVFLDEQ